MYFQQEIVNARMGGVKWLYDLAANALSPADLLKLTTAMITGEKQDAQRVETPSGPANKRRKVEDTKKFTPSEHLDKEGVAKTDITTPRGSVFASKGDGVDVRQLQKLANTR